MAIASGITAAATSVSRKLRKKHVDHQDREQRAEQIASRSDVWDSTISVVWSQKFTCTSAGRRFAAASSCVSRSFAMLTVSAPGRPYALIMTACCALNDVSA